MTGAAYDLDFAHAVRLAATGIRPKAGVDPEIEGAALARYLRGTHELDGQGLDLLAELVTGKLRTIRQPVGETLLAHAVRLSGLAWRSGKDVDAETAGGALAGMLRDPATRIGVGERNLLADLVTGELRRGVSRPPKGAGRADITAVTAALRKQIDSGSLRKNALEDTARAFGLSVRTVQNYEAETKKRERFQQNGGPK